MEYLYLLILFSIGSLLADGITAWLRRYRRTRDIKIAFKRALREPQSLIVLPANSSIKARTVDPEQPPFYAVHVQTGDDPDTLCSCHHEPIADGDRVLVWPGTEMLCRATYEALPPAGDDL